MQIYSNYKTFAQNFIRPTLLGKAKTHANYMIKHDPFDIIL